MVSVASTCSSMRTHFCEQFIQSIMSNEASCIGEKVDSNLLHDPMPSLPYQVLFLELRKLEQLAEDNVAKYEWLVSLLTELVETTFDWVSINGENRTTLDNEDTTDQQSDRLTQFALDMQFLVEVARRGGYLTTNMINSSTDLVLQMESAIVSAGFDLNRYVIDHEKAANLAMEAIKELEAQEEHKSHSDDDIDQLDQEYLPHSSRDSIDDDDNDTQNSSEISFERDEKYTSTNTNYLDHGEDDLEKDSSIYTDSLEDEKDADFVENGLMEIKRGKLQKLSLSTNAESCAENVQPVTSEIEQVGLTTSDELLQLRKIRRVSKVVKEQVL
ncbi:hypothetical protein OSB04_020260 [Centaurea solstitialis]|uniref:Uncharacterized protein n=1 Tax=Centaurea solstitialis TaxID=347529 RepID=A0AA38W3P5_9ASTR|nr:hypothetical protein OSB04_020260 [Centaurea solstitialis]